MRAGAIPVERLAHSLGSFLATQLNLDRDRCEQIRYGALILLQTAAGVMAPLPLAAALGVLPESLVAVAVATALRRFSGGFHLATPWRCIAFALLGFAGCGLAGRAGGAVLGAWPAWLRLAAAAALGLGACAVVLRHAPVTSPARPLKPAHRQRVRRNGIVLAFLYAALLAAGAAAGAWWVAPGLAGFWLQCFTLTPAGQRCARYLNRSLDGTERR